MRAARHYGERVVFVGQSTGGQLGIRMAEQGLVDGLFLLQPYVGLNFFQSNFVKIAKSVAPHLSVPPLVNTFFDQAKNAGTITQVPYRKIDPRIEVKVYLSKHDPVVSNNKTFEWIKDFAPHSSVENLTLKSLLDFILFGHMNKPKFFLKNDTVFF